MCVCALLQGLQVVGFSDLAIQLLFLMVADRNIRALVVASASIASRHLYYLWRTDNVLTTSSVIQNILIYVYQLEFYFGHHSQIRIFQKQTSAHHRKKYHSYLSNIAALKFKSRSVGPATTAAAAAFHENMCYLSPRFSWKHAEIPKSTTSRFHFDFWWLVQRVGVCVCAGASSPTFHLDVVFQPPNNNITALLASL